MSPYPRALLIDLDDTLLDDSGCVDGCWADSLAVFADRFAGLDDNVLLAEIRRQSSWFWSDPNRHRTGRLNLRAATHVVTERALQQLRLTDPSLAGELAEMYRDLREERASLFPGVVAALETLRARGVRLGLMTNGAAAAQRAKIERFALAPHFDHIVIEGEFGAGKPDRRVYDTLLDALACDPADAWAIGDNLEFDVLAPMQLGIHGIWIDSAGKGCDGQRPDRVVSNFCDIIGPSG